MRYPTEHRPSFFSSAPSLLRNCNSPEARRAYLLQQRASKHDLLLAAELQDIRRRVDRQISSVRGRQVQHEHAASLHERRLLSPTRSGLGSRSSSPELHKPRPLGASYRDFRAPVEADPLHDPLGDARAHAAAARAEVDAEALRKTRPRPGSTGRGRREREALERELATSASQQLAVSSSNLDAWCAVGDRRHDDAVRWSSVENRSPRRRYAAAEAARRRYDELAARMAGVKAASAASRAALSHYRVESAAVRRTARLNTPNTARLYAHEAFGWTDAPAGAVPLSPTLSPTLPRPPSTPWGTRSSPMLSVSPSRYE